MIPTVAFYLIFFLAFFLALYLTSILTYFLAFYCVSISIIFSGIISSIYSDILCGILSGIWVQACPAASGAGNIVLCPTPSGVVVLTPQGRKKTGDDGSDGSE